MKGYSLHNLMHTEIKNFKSDEAVLTLQELKGQSLLWLVAMSRLNGGKAKRGLDFTHRLLV